MSDFKQWTTELINSIKINSENYSSTIVPSIEKFWKVKSN